MKIDYPVNRLIQFRFGRLGRTILDALQPALSKSRSKFVVTS